MPMIVKGESPKLTLRQQKGRVVNAVAEMLRKGLSVPNIYLQPRSPYITADVLAVDRAGAGDLHAVEIRLELDFVGASTPPKNDPRTGWIMHLRKEKMKGILEQIMSLPVHYRYLAIPQSIRDSLVEQCGSLLYPADGIGRIGIIAITNREEQAPIAELPIPPERFRVDPVKLAKIEKNLLENKKIRPDIEVRI